MYQDLLSWYIFFLPLCSKESQYCLLSFRRYTASGKGDILTWLGKYICSKNPIGLDEVV